MEVNEDSLSLWSIEDDTLFYAQGLKHHSAGKGKSVYVTWNENYLINYVFKTSCKTGTTTLTKVRIAVPIHDLQLEEIANILILEMNTLLYMKSGRVYYFSSVKSMHKVEWLSGIRCMASCPPFQFSAIRLVNTFDLYERDHKRTLSLEVYKDIPQLGKCLTNDVVKHVYDISFDMENVFNCDWNDETYTLTSLITDQKNIAFLKQLVSVGNVFQSQEEVVNLNLNQEIHIFTISGNIFVLIGAIASEDKFSLFNTNVENFCIILLNTYACPVTFVRIDCEKKLLIVLLQSGHMDIWYESKRMFGAIAHCKHEVPDFLCYDFWPEKNIFYFTTSQEVLQIQIIKCNSTGAEKECIIKENRKDVSGMIACTFVEELQQLICLSINNIFYRMNFNNLADMTDINNESATLYENLNNLYALNDKRVKELAMKSQIIDELMEQPKYHYNDIEKEFRKQQILSLESKTEILKKIFQCHFEYHLYLPRIDYFDKEYVHIKATNHQSEQLHAHSIFCLIFMSLKSNQNNLLPPIFSETMWYLQISNLGESLQMPITCHILNKKLCLIFEVPMRKYIKQILPKLSLNLVTFFNHQHQYICMKFNLDLLPDEKTYLNLFNYKIQNLHYYRNPFNITNLLNELSKETRNKTTEIAENIYTFKYSIKIQKCVVDKAVETLKSNTSCSLGFDFKIYFLQQYIIDLSYNDSNEMLLIRSNCPVAMFYIKLFLIYSIQSYGMEIVDKSGPNMPHIIMNHQNEIEHLYGSLKASDSDDINCNTISIHLENLKKVYSKLRTDFYNIHT